MAGRRRDLSAEEQALWERVASSARPIGHDRPARRHEPDPVDTELPPVPAARVHREPRPRGLKPLTGLDRRTDQRLRRGAIEVDGRLDLHGMTQTAAHAALRSFLAAAQARGDRLVLVITGKGGPALERDHHDFTAGPRGVLARQVPHWLAGADLRSLVSGFREAHPRHGGSGALYVRLRRKR